MDKRFLIVEDSTTQAMRLEHLLKHAGASTTTAKSGQEALDVLAQDTNFDAILSDIDMPEIDGFDLCKRIKQLPGAKQIPFVLLVSLKDGKDIVKAMECRADSILMKEYDKTYFLPALDNLFNALNAANNGSARVYFEGAWHEVSLSTSHLASMLVASFTMAIHQKAARQPAINKV